MRLAQSSGVTYERVPLQTVYGGKTLFDLYQDYEHSLDVKEAKDVYAFRDCL